MLKSISKRILNSRAWAISILSPSIPFFSPSICLSPSFATVLHSPAHLRWSTVLSKGWSVTCGVYVSVCLTVYSELILTHSIYLSYNRSTPTCPLESVRVCVFYVGPCSLRTLVIAFRSIRYAFGACVSVRVWCNTQKGGSQSFHIDAEMLYVRLSALMTCL